MNIHEVSPNGKERSYGRALTRFPIGLRTLKRQVRAAALNCGKCDGCLGSNIYRICYRRRGALDDVAGKRIARTDS